MSNHVHLIVIPQDSEGLAASLKHTHGRYASYWNVARSSSGHAWQGRYFSCPLDGRHSWEALHYTELNPVRAHLVTEAHDWAWSSAAAHCGVVPPGKWLSMPLWSSHWTYADWREYLAAGETEADKHHPAGCNKETRSCPHRNSSSHGIAPLGFRSIVWRPGAVWRAGRPSAEPIADPSTAPKHGRTPQCLRTGRYAWTVGSMSPLLFLQAGDSIADRRLRAVELFGCGSEAS
jgi:hypothetical protein